MIHEEICTYEVCKLAKKKGFDWICLHYFRTKNKDLFRVFPCEDWSNIEDRINAPTQSLLQRWLREEKGVVVEVMCLPTTRTNSKYEYKRNIFWGSDGHYIEGEYGDEIFDTYELALEDAELYVLKNLL